MESLQSFEQSVLVDMLAVQTEKYLKMQSDGATEEEFAKCALTIKALQKEIDSRNKKVADTSS
jgi:hypothetical protein